MAEILIKVADYVHADPEEDRRGVHKRGDIINIKPDGWSDHPNWAQSSYPYQKSGEFVLIKIPGTSIDEWIDRNNPWKREIGYEVLESQPSQGRYILRAFETFPGTTGRNNLTANRIQGFLEKWGCIDISFFTNSVQFTFSLWNAARSDGFWKYRLIGIVFSFTLVSYSGQTGKGIIQADYILAPQGPEQELVERRVLTRGGTILQSSTGSIIFELERSDILKRFQHDAKITLESPFMRHRYAVVQTLVDLAISAGGVLTLDRGQLLENIRDKASE